MGLDSLITVILVLVILGFIVWLLMRFVPIASPFREIILFVIVLAVVLWLLSFFGLWSGPAALRR